MTFRKIPTSATLLKAGPRLRGNTGTVFTLVSDAQWSGANLPPGSRVTQEGRACTVLAASGAWPIEYDTDYPWRMIDTNETNILWECMVDGDLYHVVTRLGETPHSVGPANRKEFRAELGRRGWKVVAPGHPRECGDYEAHTVDPPIIVEAPVAPVHPAPPQPPSKPPRPTRSSRVSVLVAEMSMTTADRLRRLR